MMTGAMVQGRVQRRTVRWIGRIVVFLGGALALAACHQNGTVYAVTTTADTVDANPGDGICADVGGNCSLRAAVMEANATAGVEEIRLSDGATYQLTRFGLDDTAVAGDLDITEAVVLTGDATIEAALFTGRVIHALHPSGLVEIDGPDLTGGLDGIEPAASGAALYAASAGNVSLVHSEVFGNNTSNNVIDVVGGGTLYLWSSTVHDNGQAGGAAVAATVGRIDLQNATVAGNTPPIGPISPAVRVADGGGASAKAHHSTIFDEWDGAGAISSSIVERCAGTAPTSGGHNINADGSCGFAAVGDQSVNAQLGPIQDNGGAVPTAAPAPTSPAIDTFGGAGCTIFSRDARDVVRPNNGVCDTGAVELQIAE